MFTDTIKSLNQKIMDKVSALNSDIKIDITDAEYFDNYSVIYLYFHPKKELLQIIGNYKIDGKQTKKLIYNFKKKVHKNISHNDFLKIYKDTRVLVSLIKERKYSLLIFDEIKDRHNLGKDNVYSDINTFLS